jgi:hypothetical protein
MPPTATATATPATAATTPEQQRRRTRRAVRLVLTEVFDMPAVLRGRKPAAALHGLPELLVAAALVLMRTWSNSVQLRVGQQVTQALYLRDTGNFFKLLAANVLLSFVSQSLYFPMRGVLQMRVVVAWRTALTQTIHDRYHNPRTMAFLRQQGLPDGRAVSDPEDRIAGDVGRACGTISSAIFSVVMNATLWLHGLYQMWTITNRWHIPISIAYGVLSNRLRERLNPSLVHGRFAGRLAQVNAEYRSAHHALAENAESIVACGGAKRETAHINEKFGRLMDMWKELLVLATKSSLSYRVVNCSHQPDALVNVMDLVLHVPLLRPSNSLRVAAGASTQEGLQANAAMMGQQMLHRQVLFDSVMKFQEMCVRCPVTCPLLRTTTHSISLTYRSLFRTGVTLDAC